MSDSFLSFNASSSFRNNLMARNLAPYNVPGAYSPPSGDANYEISPLNDNPVIDSPNNLIGTTNQANQLYPLNEYGPEGGYNNIISTDGPPLPVDSNQGEYGQDDAQLDLVNEFFIDNAYIKNTFGPEGGYKDLVIVTDIISNSQYFLPYSDNSGFPLIFSPSTYTPLQILINDNPTGSNGPLSQDSELAQRAALALREEFQRRIEFETQQLVSSVFQLDQLEDPFEASLVATGQQPLIGKNWKITVPENPVLAAVSFANRITGTYFPVSPIPGDYFNETNQVLPGQTEGALNVVNNLTGGLLGPILNKYRNPSEVFVENTGYGQKSVLFKSLDYNIYRPKYNKGLVLGVSDAISNLLGANEDKGGGYYVGSDQAEPSTINTPANEIPVDRFGKQQPSPVYGPSDLAKLYEGNVDQIKFGLAASSYTNQGGVAGQFVWLSPKYKDNLGFKVKPGGDPVQPQDQQFDVVKFEFNQSTQSTDFDFKGGSILDNTQRLIESADNVTGAKRLEHVGNAINQVSKVFNDGYKELTKGSRVIAYYDSVTNSQTMSIDGTEVGSEYCRIFQKDTPYLTYADLQKTDGITTSGRKFSYSVFDNTYNLNIAPLRNPGSTNIIDGKVKKYMFSLENLAWRTSSEPGFTYDDLPVCERGPNGGRIMWFPPYNLTFSDSSTASWNSTSFLGRPEPIYTYKDTKRSGSIGWTIVVDSPASMNTIVEKQLANMSPEQVDSIMDSFFAGCVKYDLYDLAVKFNQIPINELYTYQEILQNPRLTDEEKFGVLKEIPINEGTTTGGANNVQDGGGDGKQSIENTNSNTANGSNTTTTSDIDIESLKEDIQTYVGYAFYFHNDCPECVGSTSETSSQPYSYWYDSYINTYKPLYDDRAPANVTTGLNGESFSSNGIPQFFSSVIEGNFSAIKSDFLPVKLKQVLVDLGGKVTIELRGSASAPASEDYNVNLSKRRNNSVEQWLLKQTVGTKTLAEWKKDNKFSITYVSSGEGAVLPKNSEQESETGDPGVQGYNLTNRISCTKNIYDVSKQKVTSRSQIYSIPAMACRRVAIDKITISDIVEPPKPKWTCEPGVGCKEDPNGIYESKEACETACKPPLKWKCLADTGECVEDPSGDFLSKEECQKECGKTQQIRYACVNGKCQEAADGRFLSEQECIDDGCGGDDTPTPPRIDPVPDIKKSIKEGISKKILRRLFSECDYFEVIKESNPMVYASLKDKIKYFSPTFHSMTPEGLNARLTFLNQCVRPGQTIPVIGPDGKPKYNDARNTSFGAPPVLVLRIGDFYHTKIIPNQLSIQYEPLIYDINPEGIGIQPMLAKITLGFDFIGGHGLAGPVAQLQNALSFNYYANTEIYDERAVATESTKERDEQIVGKIIDRQGSQAPVQTPINNQPIPESGGATIGNILTTEVFEDGTVQTGTTEFKSIFKELSDSTNNYFKTIVNQLKTLNETTNLPITQLVILDRLYKNGNLNNHSDSSKQKIAELFGKSEKVEDKVAKLIEKTISDVENKTNPIILAIENANGGWSSATKRDVINTLVQIITDKENEINNTVIGPLNEITKYQEGYVQTFRKLDLVSIKVDGYKLDTGEYKVYNLLGPQNVFDEIVVKYSNNTADIIKQFNAEIKESQYKILRPEILTENNTSFNPLTSLFSTKEETRRFYFTMSDVFTNDNKYNEFVNKLLTEKVKGNSDLVKLIESTCNDLKIQFTREYDVEKKLFTDFQATESYQKFVNYKIDEFETTVTYTTKKDDDNNKNKKLLRQTYSDLNINNDRKTFNDKITFN